jgi:hypothetical protein
MKSGSFTPIQRLKKLENALSAEKDLQAKGVFTSWI